MLGLRSVIQFGLPLHGLNKGFTVIGDIILELHILLYATVDVLCVVFSN